MRKNLRSMRVRLTATATLVVALALIVASFGLVLSMQRSLAGQSKSQLRDLVNDVALSLEKGQDVSPSALRKISESGMVIGVRDESGVLVGAFGNLTQIDSADRGLQQQQDIQGSVLGGPSNSVGGNGPMLTTSTLGDTTIIKKDQIIMSKTVNTPNGKRFLVASTPLAVVARSVDAVVRILWIGTPLLIVLAGFVTWRLTGRALQPIESLRFRADTISHATLSERLPVPASGDEVERLARTLNHMLDRLDYAASRQREFTSDASHELRSPLAAMHTALEVASVHPDSTDNAELVSSLLAEVERVEGLVSALMELARVDEFANAVSRESVDLTEIVRSNASTDVELDLVDVTVSGNAHQLESVVRNLLSNAHRYANKVAVHLQQDADCVVLTVDDDGPGIPPEQRERVFERFTRLDEGRVRSAGGVGIGLALVQRIVQLHDGSVQIADSPLGGARFEVRLPANA